MPVVTTQRRCSYARQAAALWTLALLGCGCMPVPSNVAAAEGAPQSTERADRGFIGVPRNAQELKVLENRVCRAIEKVRPAVVDVAGSSGVIVSEDGYVLTAYHVVRREGPVVPITLAGGRKVQAKRLGFEWGADMALLKILGEEKWPYAEMGHSSVVEPGQWGLAIGYPAPFDRKHAPITRLGRVLASSPWWLACDCAGYGGDCGGALVDLDGRVIAIHRRWTSHTPIDRFRDSWTRLVEGDEFCDPNYATMTSATTLGFSPAARADHPEVGSVIPGSPAETAGLEPGDILVACEGKPIRRNLDLMIGLFEATIARRPGVELQVRRGEQVLDFTVRFDPEFSRVPGYEVMVEAINGSVWLRKHPEVEQHRKSQPEVKAAFRESIRAANEATVWILVDGVPAGLGTVVDPDGYIVTKGDLPNGKTVCRFPAGRELIAEIVSTSEKHCLAVLKVEASGLRTVSWRTGGSPPVGSWVAVVDQHEGPLAIGVVSAEPRPITAELYHRPLGMRRSVLPSVILHDALIGPEDCGGAVVDVDGKVVGINVAPMHEVSVGMVPSDVVRAMLTQLKEESRRVP